MEDINECIDELMARLAPLILDDTKLKRSILKRSKIVLMASPIWIY